VESSKKDWETDWCIKMGEGKIFGITIKDPVWYLIVYPIVFALIFILFLILIGLGLAMTQTIAGIISIVIAGVLTLIWRSEAKFGKAI